MSALFHLVCGAARTAAEARRAEAKTGKADSDWWAGRTALPAEAAPTSPIWPAGFLMPGAKTHSPSAGLSRRPPTTGNVGSLAGLRTAAAIVD
ncbi:hypothetical protein OG589_05025 [Sphaerisporangium sp. NBC_01403]|uniref:hypothetical protein n=1 Tax=Sphaerisporangium sp. NBC_01403 TaxID=2903599 RepID=UPI00324DA2C5